MTKKRGEVVFRYEERTDAQRRFSRAAEDADIVFAVGAAGTGKTFAALGTAIRIRGEHPVVVSRPLVEASSGVGYLKGDLNEKLGPWMSPITDCFSRLVYGATPADLLKVIPLAFCRGLTFNGPAILDEAQNCTVDELLLFMTRLGRGSKMFIVGDPYQSDIPRSGLVPWIKALKSHPRVKTVVFPRTDTLRNPLVAELVARKPRL